MSVHDLLDRMRSIGLVIDAVEPDGEIHRVAVEGKSAKKNGWYVAHQAGSKLFAAYGRWDRPELFHCKYPESGMVDLTREEKAILKLIQKKQRAERERAHKAAEYRARKLWNEGVVTKIQHPYMAKKRIIGQIKVDKRSGAIMVPLYSRHWNLVNIQLIWEDKKRFLKGGKLKNCFGAIGHESIDMATVNTIYICEGWATGMTIHEATRMPVILAMNVHNLRPVAKTIRRLYPKADIVICADNDHERRDGNIGIEVAKEVAMMIGGTVKVPKVKRGTDFNDMFIEAGNLDAVREILLGDNRISTPEEAKSLGVLDEGLKLPGEILDPGGLISIGMEGLVLAGTPDIPQYNLSLVLITIANAIAGKLVYGNVWPTLYFIRVGGTSTGKTTSITNMKMAILTRGATDFFGPTGFASGPGLLRGLMQNPRCLITLDEMTSLFRRPDRGVDTITAAKLDTLMELYTCAGMQYNKPYGGSGKDSIIIDSPCMTLIGNATPVIFDYLASEDMETGVIQRFEFWHYAGSVPTRRCIEGNYQQLHAFADNLIEMRDIRAGSALPGVTKLQQALQAPYNMTAAPEALEQLGAFSREILTAMNSQEDEGFKGIVSRKYDAAIKYAMLHAVSRAGGLTPTIDQPDIEYGIKLAGILADWKLNCLTGKMYEGKFHRRRRLILEAAVSAVAAGVRPTKGVLESRRRKLKDLTAREFDECVKTMVEADELIVDNSGRRPAYYPAKQ